MSRKAQVYDYMLSYTDSFQSFDLISEAVILVDDETKTISGANAAALLLYGYRREELAGMKINALFAGGRKYRHRKDHKGQILNLCGIRKDTTPFLSEISMFSFVRGGRKFHLEIIREITEGEATNGSPHGDEKEISQVAVVNSALAKIGRIVNSTLNLEEVYEQFSMEIGKIIPSDRVSIGLLNHEQGLYQYDYASGIPMPERVKGTVISLPPSIRKVVSEKRGSFLQGECPVPPGPFSVGIKSIILAPLLSRDEVIGVLFLGSVKSSAYTDKDLKIAEDVARQIGGTVASAQLYTQLKQSEKSLRENEERFRLLIENAPDAVFVHVEDRITYVNPAAVKLFGVSTASQLLGERVLDWIHPDKRALAFERMKRIATVPEPLPRVDQKYLRLDGTIVDVEASAVPFKHCGRSGVLVFARDITERKRGEEEKGKLQAQLAQAQKMESVGRLAGGVAHDFNNMLGVIIGNAEVAMMKVNSEGALYQHLSEILKAGHRSADLVRQLLAFARKQTVSPKVLNLNEAVSGMLKMLRRLMGEDIDMAWVPGVDLWPVKIDPSQIDQILINLVANARDAIEGVGKVTIETDNVIFDDAYCSNHPGATRGQFTLLAISDNGMGMSKEILENIFEPYFTTKELGKGTGLGLATVYGVVKQNNGFIYVYSEPGKGTTFKVYLPRFTPSTLVKDFEAMPEPMRKGTEMVLIVEDEAAILRIGKAMIESLGYRVLTASSPQEAIRIGRECSERIDLLLTDVIMPEMSGRDLAEEFKLNHPESKCLYMSGYTANVIARNGILCEGVDFIEKPFMKKDLAPKIRQVLDKE